MGVVPIKPTRAAADPRIGESHAEGVVGAACDHAADIDACVRIEVDEIAVARRARDAREDADALGRIVSEAMDLLIHNAIDAAISTQAARIAGA